MTVVLRMRALAFSCVAAILTSCGTGTVKHVHPDDEPVRDVEASDIDIRGMARTMASSLLEVPRIADNSKPATIAFLRIENRTQDPDFDSYNILSRIRTEILTNSNGRLQFIDDTQLEAILAERDRKRTSGSSPERREQIPGVDFFLAGFAYSQRKYGNDGTVTGYHRYEFRLTDAETAVVAWERDYEFKKSGRRGVVYR